MERDSTKTCERCGRPILYPISPTRDDPSRHIERAIVRHQFYGCDSGCEGHAVIGIDCRGEEVFEEFEFTHPYTEDHEAWAREFAATHLPGVPLDWSESRVVD